jgi:hypothetical protein
MKFLQHMLSQHVHNIRIARHVAGQRECIKGHDQIGRRVSSKLLGFSGSGETYVIVSHGLVLLFVGSRADQRLSTAAQFIAATAHRSDLQRLVVITVIPIHALQCFGVGQHTSANRSADRFVGAHRTDTPPPIRKTRKAQDCAAISLVNTRAALTAITLLHLKNPCFFSGQQNCVFALADGAFVGAALTSTPKRWPIGGCVSPNLLMVIWSQLLPRYLAIGGNFNGQAVLSRDTPPAQPIGNRRLNNPSFVSERFLTSGYHDGSI